MSAVSLIINSLTAMPAFNTANINFSIISVLPAGRLGPEFSWFLKK